jgi:hypothetical protein
LVDAASSDVALGGDAAADGYSGRRAGIRRRSTNRDQVLWSTSTGARIVERDIHERGARAMGLIRKTMSVSTMGAVNVRSNGERTARTTKKMAQTMDRHCSEAALQSAVLESRARVAQHDRQQPVGPVTVAGATLMAELNEIASLYASGVLTDAEFATAKAKLLT